MITDKMLAEAAAELSAAILISLPEPTECKHVFSDSFEKKMKKVFRKGNHPVRYRIMQRVASLVLVLFLSFMTLLTISPSVRAVVFGWVRETFEFLTRYSYSGEEANNTLFTNYYLSYTPDEYEEIDRIETPGRVIVYYKNIETNQIIYFIYSQNNTSILYYIANQEHDLEEINIDGMHVDFYRSTNKNYANSIVWYDMKTDTFFCISSHEGKDELIKIYKNIKIF